MLFKLAANNSSSTSLNQNDVASLLSEADKLNQDAADLRKSAASKTGTDKDADITNAKKLESEAVTKKVEAANKQEQLNTATYDANKESLEEFANLAKGKNIADLSSADMLTNEASLFFKQAG
jgi:hypothetical protein